MKQQEMTINEIRKIGIGALVEALGPVNMARFLQQFDTGYGDYTREREKILEGLTLDDIVNEIEAKRK